jgi:hypothetical protein
MLFRNTGIGLPKSTQVTFGMRGGGLTKGTTDLMGIQSHQKHKIWSLLDQFDQTKSSSVNSSQASSVNSSQASSVNSSQASSPVSSPKSRASMDDFHTSFLEDMNEESKDQTTSFGSARQVFHPDNVESLTENLELVEDKLITTDSGKVTGKLRDEIDPQGRLRLFTTGNQEKDYGLNQIRLFLKDMKIPDKSRATFERTMNHKFQHTKYQFDLDLRTTINDLNHTTKVGSDLELRKVTEDLITTWKRYDNGLKNTSPAVRRSKKLKEIPISPINMMFE